MRRKKQQQDIPQNAIGVTAEYRTPKRKARGTIVILGLGAIVTIGLVIIVLAIVFRRVVEPIVLYSVGTVAVISVVSVAVIGMTKITQAISTSRTNKEIQALTLREKQLEVARRELELPYLTASKDNWLYDLRTKNIIPSPHQTVKDTSITPQLPAEIQELPRLLDVLTKSDCVLISGGRGSGKTNSALWWLSTKKIGTRLVLDPKGIELNPWYKAYVAQDANSMVIAVNRVVAEMERRKDRKLTGELPIYLLADELHHLIDVLELPIMDSIISLVTFGRDWNINASFTASDKGVESLNLKGRSGLRDGLVQIKTHKSAITGEYKSWLFDDGKIEVLPPSEYRGTNSSRIFKSTAKMRQQRQNGVEQKIISLYQQGESLRTISQEVFGQGKFGSTYNEKIKAVLANNQVSE